MPGQEIAAPRYPDDDGRADPAVTAALAAYAMGQGSEHAALAALAGSRLLVPVVAVLTGPDESLSRGRREKTSEMVLPTLVGKDGRHAVLAFTGMDALTRWRGDARPVPVPAGQVCQAGVEKASAVVIDVAGPVPLAVDGARLAALAAGRPVPLPHEEPDLLASARAAVPAGAGIAGLALLPGQDDSDLTVELTVTPGAHPEDLEALAHTVAEGIAAAAGGRLRRGITFAVVAG